MCKDTNSNITTNEGLPGGNKRSSNFYENTFQTVKRKRGTQEMNKAKSPKRTVTNIETSNRYEALSESDGSTDR